MLTKDQRQKLDSRDQLSSEERKANEFSVRKGLRKWLDGADELSYVMDTLPPKQLEKIITNQDFTKLARATIKLLQVVGTPHIIEEKYVTDGVIPIHEKTDLPTRPGPVRGFKQTLRDVTPEELERAQLIIDHVKELYTYLGEKDLEDLRDEIGKILEVS